MRLSNLHLTYFKVDHALNATTEEVKTAMEEGDVMGQWHETQWYKNLQAKSKRKSMNDFDRFKLRKAKLQRNQLVKKALKKKVTAMRKAGQL